MRHVRHHLGITAFGTNGWTAANEGDRLMPEHEEDEGSEELYVVLRGRARFEIDGDTVDAPEGTLVFVPPQVNRTAFADEPGTTVLAIGSRVGQAYEARGWEVWAEFQTAYEAGDYEAVIARAYYLACCEALTGRKQDAIAHLRSPSRDSRSSVTSRRTTPTSTRSETSRRFASSSNSGIATKREIDGGELAVGTRHALDRCAGRPRIGDEDAGLRERSEMTPELTATSERDEESQGDAASDVDRPTR